MTAVALATTTIHQPVECFQAWRAALPDALLVVAGDRRSDDEMLRGLLTRVGGESVYLGIDDPATARYVSHRALGENTIARRNLAVLEALRLGAEIVICIDDDNWPASWDYAQHLSRFLAPVWEPPIRTVSGWWHAGVYAEAPYITRGYPVSRWAEREAVNGVAVDTREPRRYLGVIQSLVFDDPDCAAADRLVRAPKVGCYSTAISDSTILDPADTWTPINSQATLWRRETAPLAFMLHGAGRYDDIWAGYLAQRVMAATGYLVSVGRPYVQQRRNPHDVLADLDAERFGMEHTEAFCALLKEITLDSAASVLDNLATLKHGLSRFGFDSGWDVPMARTLGAWLEDVGAVL